MLKKMPTTQIPNPSSAKTTSHLNNDILNDYFSNLNPIAKKISLDINETKLSYEHIWNELNTYEQIDIINETLIKPEIALRYFDNFSESLSKLSETSTNSSIISLINDTNDDSVLTLLNQSNDQDKIQKIDIIPNTIDENNKIDIKLKQKLCSQSATKILHHNQKNKINIQKKINTKNIYQYDCKNLLTYHQQKCGLKYDMCGIYYDEHSYPFSYKTKSQINLKLFRNDLDIQSSPPPSSTYLLLNKDSTLIDNNKYRVEPSSLKIDSIYSKTNNNTNNNNNTDNKIVMPSTSTLINYQKLNAEFTANINQNKSFMNRYLNGQLTSSNTTKKNMEKLINNDHNNDNINDINKPTNNLLIENNDTNNGINNCNNFLKFISKNNFIFNNTTTTTTSTNNANINDYEFVNLMNNINYSSSGSNITSSSAEDDEHENDKTLHEDSNLLLDNDPLRKGFDFLNNW